MFGIGPAELVVIVVILAVSSRDCAISGVAPTPVVATAQAGSLIALGVALSQWASW